MNLNNVKILVGLTDKVIDVGDLINKMKDSGAGALSIFLGILVFINRNNKR